MTLHAPSVEEYLAADHFLAIHDPQATPEAVAAALAWIEASPVNRELYERIGRFSAACAAAEEAAASPRPRRAAERPRRAVFGLAVTAAVGLLLGVLMFRPQPAAPPQPSATYATGRGQIQKLALADGSSITLAGASRVRVSYGRTRDVELLAGRGYFEVAKDARRPFVVHARGGSVTALGTAFDVQSRQDGVFVTLAHGSVKVQTEGGDGRAESVRLSPGQQVAYDDSGQLGASHFVALDDVLAWREGKLYFVGQRLSVVIAELNHYSSRPIVLDDPGAASLQVTGIVQVSGIADWLRGLARIADFQVIDGGDQIILRSKRRQVATAAARKD